MRKTLFTTTLYVNGYLKKIRQSPPIFGIKTTLSRVKGRVFSKVNLENNGERVDIRYDGKVNFDKLNLYEKSHYRRYEFARELVKADGTCGDFACGTGYGSVMLAEKGRKVIGADIDSVVIKQITSRYRKVKNVEFRVANLLDMVHENLFESIVSFETVEHFREDDILSLFRVYHKALKPGGRLVFSTPYMQERSEAALKLGFHMSFQINEERIDHWLKESGFKVELYKYQNYETHAIEANLAVKDFIICVAMKV
jgi:2-polyprenyl-3-methyl-5-hydroxy-6-metoxy-1,4-benzoquinol methylase